MKFSLETAQDILVHACQPGEVILRIPAEESGKPPRQESFTSSLVLGHQSEPENWQVATVTELALEHFELAWRNRPDIVLLGTGEMLRFPSLEIRQQFGLQGIGLEVMDNAAACRTYNVLVAEGRDVIAYLMIP